MVIRLDKLLDENVGMQQEESLGQPRRDGNFVGYQVLVCLKKHAVSNLVVSYLLLLISYQNCGVGGLAIFSDRHIKPEHIVGILDLAIVFPDC